MKHVLKCGFGKAWKWPSTCCCPGMQAFLVGTGCWWPQVMRRASFWLIGWWRFLGLEKWQAFEYFSGISNWRRWQTKVNLVLHFTFQSNSFVSSFPARLSIVIVLQKQVCFRCLPHSCQPKLSLWFSNKLAFKVIQSEHTHPYLPVIIARCWLVMLGDSS